MHFSVEKEAVCILWTNAISRLVRKMDSRYNYNGETTADLVCKQNIYREHTSLFKTCHTVKNLNTQNYIDIDRGPWN